jgi:hypothetical protein
MTKPKYLVGYSDGSGKEYVTLNGKAVATTAWGCSCCKPQVTIEHIAVATEIANTLNAAKK